MNVKQYMRYFLVIGYSIYGYADEVKKADDVLNKVAQITSDIAESKSVRIQESRFVAVPEHVVRSNLGIVKKQVNIESNQSVSSISESSGLSNIMAIDDSADEMILLKRKLEIEKERAELKKLQRENKPSGDASTNNITKIVNTYTNENAQTVVTGVALDTLGNKLAWLKFIDGGALKVVLGSRVGNYVVSDINMLGVTLGRVSGRGRQYIYLKRSYAPSIANTNNGSVLVHSNPFAPSPVLTGVNAGFLGASAVPPLETEQR